MKRNMMRRLRTPSAAAFAVALAVGALTPGARESEARPAGESPAPIPWQRALHQRGQWYAGAEAARIADNVLLYQRASGGWSKNIDMARRLSGKQKAALEKARARGDSTLDNGATHTQLRYLARVYAAAKLPRVRTGFLKGMDYLLRAQYPNGGWPQFYPSPRGYAGHITFNDGAMIGAMSVLRDIAEKKPHYAFVDSPRRQKAARAVRKGIECILKCQIIVKGRRTAWCAQHDSKTLKPAPARSYEKISISGGESVGVVKFLMGIEKPSAEIIEAVQGAVAWFDRARLTCIRQVTRPAPSMPGGRDKVIIKDPGAPPLWARFYEIGTNRPIFCSRDGVARRRLADISHERRNGYAWYGAWPADLLSKAYPPWQKKHAPDDNAFQKTH